jgi:hypothetical protein
MPSAVAVFLAGIILVIVFALVLIILSSEVLTKRASQIVAGVFGSIPKALERAFLTCRNYDIKDRCIKESVCQWCETTDENQNTVTFCTTQKRAADLCS